MVQLGGFEPPTSCSTDRRSNQLSYNCIRLRPRAANARKLGATARFGKAEAGIATNVYPKNKPGQTPGLAADGNGSGGG